ncbi:phosphoglucomutase/phosphomannomutase family protein [Salinarchaeum sp. IM2453]|uniref:phosphoglucomutase/phosphomannomutase family protein n=1 Tax=Salinarchaeum sp. IM2453 TaxID=2862870 RepID=UPI001C829624|nr:phosphoglucomutase/phosphomannomutase family protein [Salinarchaeum sp. IM2453]QZA87673.1 phosphoglucomutase/phosphomannomutase family protein [Salinarchaeum sp. IM2453]
MDVAFGTDGWRATRQEITPNRLHAIAEAISKYLHEVGKDEKPVAVGYDARRHAESDAQELARVLAAEGHEVLFADRDCPTPSLAHGIVERGLAGGIMVTASHNPPEYGGVKFIPEDGAPALPAVTDTIESYIDKPEYTLDDPATIRKVDFLTPHIRAVQDRINADLNGLTVAYDGLYGSGRGVTDQVLENAGAEVLQFRCDRDPEFGGEAPNPTADRLEQIIDAVNSGEADIGIANDGDADRIAVVTSNGYVDANKLFGIYYTYLLQSESGPAVRTVSTTFLIDRIAQAHAEDVVETPVGFKWVAKAMDENDALIGGEESGGFTIRDHVRNKDGVLAGLLACAAAVEQPIEEWIDELLEQHGEIHQDRISIDCPDHLKAETMGKISDNRPESIAGESVTNVNTADGVKMLLADGAWILVRPSGTEPKLRIYAEADTEIRVEELLETGQEFVVAQKTAVQEDS